MAAVDAFRLRPGGKLPAVTENVGAGNPVILGLTLTLLPRFRLRVAGYAKPGACTTVNTLVAVAEVAPSLSACRVTVKTPGLTGVPETNPVLAFKRRPGGRPNAPKRVGEPLAVIEYE